MEFPLGTNYRPGRSLPVEVEIANRGEAFAADVVLRDLAGTPSSALVLAENETLEGAVRLDGLLRPAAGRAEIAVQLQIGDWNPQSAIRNLQSDFVARAEEVPRALSGSERLLVLVEEVPGMLVLPEAFAGADGPVEVVRVRPESLPRVCEGLESVDVLVFGRTAPVRIDASREKAVADWLLGGGRVVFASGRSCELAARMLTPVSRRGLLGAHTSWEKFKKATGADESDVRLWLDGPEREEYRDGKHLPAVISMRYGFGRVLLLGFEPMNVPGTPDGKRGREAGWPTEAVEELSTLLDLPEARRVGYPGSDGDPRVDRDAFRALSGTTRPGRLVRRAIALAAASLAIIISVIVLFYRKRPGAFGRFFAAVVAAAVAVSVLVPAVLPPGCRGAGRLVLNALSADGRSAVTTEWLVLPPRGTGTTVAAAGKGGWPQVKASSVSQLAARTIITNAPRRSLWLPSSTGESSFDKVEVVFKREVQGRLPSGRSRTVVCGQRTFACCAEIPEDSEPIGVLLDGHLISIADCGLQITDWDRKSEIGSLPSHRSPAGYCIRQAARFAPCLIYRLPPTVYHGAPVLSYGGYVEKVGEFVAVELEEVE